MALIIVDIETDGFLEELTKIYCVSVYYQDKDSEWKIYTTTDYDKMRQVFLKENQTIVMHYGVGFDLPAVKKVLGVELPKSSYIIDTVAVSFALYPMRTKVHISHGLEAWGTEFGVEKTEVADDEWKNADIELMIERCEQDIKINLRLWLKMWDYLVQIYDGDTKTIIKYLRYLTFKMECLRDQEEIKLTIDMNRVDRSMKYFLKLKSEKHNILLKTMPRNLIKETKSMPKKMYKKDESLSALGIKWLLFLKNHNLPETHKEDVVYFDKSEEPNPQSTDQVKSWLYSLGWKPITFEERKNTKGEFKKIPQVNLKGGKLCPSVKRLVKVEQSVEELEGLGVIKHRFGLLKSFFTAAAKPIYNKKYTELSEDEVKALIKKSKKEGGLTVVAGARAFTKTLRLAHLAPIANLPKVTGKGDIQDGKYIRGVIVAPKGYEICGSDMSSLEARVRDHFIFPYDPEYVKTMMGKGFDSHLDFCLIAKAMTEGEVEFYKWYKNKDRVQKLNPMKDLCKEQQSDLFKKLDKIRFNHKTAGYAHQYGAGAAKVAGTLDIPISQAIAMHKAYWRRNWSVKSVAKDALVKTVKGKKWILNPINGFYYFLENDKDRFSALCQSGGTYLFDIWIYNMVKSKLNLRPSLQYHDEIMVYTKFKDREKVEKTLMDSIAKLNRQLGLLRDMGCDVQYGNCYSDVH